MKTHDQIIKQIYRIWANYLARKLLNTPITPNQITVSRLFLIVFASTCILNENYLYNFIAAFLIILFSMFDALDGSLAVQKNQRSIYGTWLDPQVDRIGFLILFVVIAYDLSFIHKSYGFLTFYTLVMFYFRGLLFADIRLKEKFKLLRYSNNDIGSSNSRIKEIQVKRFKLLRWLHLQICPHTHNVALYIAIGCIFDINHLVIVYLSLYISIWYIWDNYKILMHARKIDQK